MNWWDTWLREELFHSVLGYLVYSVEHLHITSIVNWRDADEIYNDHCARKKNIAVERTPDILYLRNDIAMPCITSREALNWPQWRVIGINIIAENMILYIMHKSAVNI